MSRNADVNEPTREFPEYATGRTPASPPEADRRWAADATAGTEEGTGTAVADSGAGAGAAPDAAGAPPGAGGQPPSPPSADSIEPPPSRGRGLFWLVGIVGLAAVLVLGLQSAGLWPSLRNPFVQEQTDRSQPALLRSIQDLSRYVAAEGNYQVVIDLQKDRRYVPEFLLNDRTLFVGAGSVESYVDFATIPDSAITESADRRSVEIKLPAPQLGETNLDLKNSYVFAENRGLLNRLADVFGGDPNRQRDVYQLAEERIAAAARESGLGDRAQENTRKMLEGLLRSLGFERVTITFTTP